MSTSWKTEDSLRVLFNTFLLVNWHWELGSWRSRGRHTHPFQQDTKCQSYVTSKLLSGSYKIRLGECLTKTYLGQCLPKLERKQKWCRGRLVAFYANDKFIKIQSKRGLHFPARSDASAWAGTVAMEAGTGKLSPERVMLKLKTSKGKQFQELLYSPLPTPAPVLLFPLPLPYPPPPPPPSAPSQALSGSLRFCKVPFCPQSRVLWAVNWHIVTECLYSACLLLRYNGTFFLKFWKWDWRYNLLCAMSQL